MLHRIFMRADRKLMTTVEDCRQIAMRLGLCEDVQIIVVPYRRRARELDGYINELDGDGSAFEIGIQSNMSQEAVVDTVIHEFAHLLDWSPIKNQWDHSDTFWVQYGRLWRMWRDEA